MPIRKIYSNISKQLPIKEIPVNLMLPVSEILKENNEFEALADAIAQQCNRI